MHSANGTAHERTNITVDSQVNERRLTVLIPGPQAEITLCELRSCAEALEYGVEFQLASFDVSNIHINLISSVVT